METSRDDFVIAIRSAFLNKGTQQRFSLLGLILFSIFFLILGSFNIKAIDYLKISLKEVVYRSSFMVSGPENLVKSIYLKTQNHFNVYKEKEKEKLELKELRAKNLTNNIIILENIKYKKLIDDYFIKDNETYAKVLIDKQSPFLRSIILNKGSKNNIKLGMVVLDENYLIGKVIEVNFFTSRALLISDINSKIPVSLQPGDIQAIMSGYGKRTGILQYIKNSNDKENKGDLTVLTSGAGGVFLGGIPIGIIKNSEGNLNNGNQIVDFYKNFSQLKYVKIVSYSKEKGVLDKFSVKNYKEIEDKIEERNQEQEALRILLEQKKIADETRIKIEEENIKLKENIIKLENKMAVIRKTIQQDETRKKDILFIKLNAIYEKKCKKNFFNNLYVKNSENYKNCILNKGKIKKN
ncbi:rod shape-determining protein MreC [Candidatus Pelagibacter sp.]|nr:rod shape-determining protein MreC [Candidatus Pelagibacter sp.]